MSQYGLLLSEQGILAAAEPEQYLQIEADHAAVSWGTVYLYNKHGELIKAYGPGAWMEFTPPENIHFEINPPRIVDDRVPGNEAVGVGLPT
jgi:hypothetical protein